MKYKLTGETKLFSGTLVHQIIATRSFGLVREGTVGGWIESEANLSQQGRCWIAEQAVAMGNARVCEDAQLRGAAAVWDNAVIKGNASIEDDAAVFGFATVEGNARVFEKASVCENARIQDDAEVCATAQVFGGALVLQGAHVLEEAEVSGDARVGAFCRVTRACSQSPVHLTGLNYFITIQDSDMTIGCKTMSLKKWAKLKPKVAARLDPDNKDTERLWVEYQDALLDLARSAGRL